MFLNPLGLFALAAVPAVVALHLFRRRFAPRTVSASFLWSAEDRTSSSGRTRTPLRRSPSFWCEVLAALLLALALAGPRPFGATEATHLVVVLDRSASMGAARDGESAWERGTEAILERIEDLPQGSRVTLIGSGRSPAVVAGPATLPVEARERLADEVPGRASHSLASALALATELVGEGRVVVVTDSFTPDEFPTEVELLSVGESASNLGIVHASRRRTTDAGPKIAERISLNVASFGGSAAEAAVTLSTLDGEPLARRRLELEPRASRHVAFELPPDTPLLVAKLETDTASNALESDDVAYLAPAPIRTVRLASTLPRELGVHLGLDSANDPSNIDRWTGLAPDSVDVLSPGVAHLVLTDSLAAWSAPGDAWLFAVAAPEGERQHLVGPFLTDPAHPLLDGVTLEGIVWTIGTESPLAGAPFVSAGSQPLATELERDGRVAWLMNLDVGTSSLHRSPDWPILLANAVEARRAALPGPAATTLALGAPFRFEATAPAAYRWSAVAGAAQSSVPERHLNVRSRILVDDIPLPGVYRLDERASEDGEFTLRATVGVSLCDAAESDLSNAGSGTRDAEADEATIRAGFSWVEALLLVLAAALLAADWWVIDRVPFGVRSQAGGAA